MMLVSSGFSVLLTSILFRFVINYALVAPLRLLQKEIEVLEVDSLNQSRIDIYSQPIELRSLALSVNDFQDKIFRSLSRERQFVEEVAHQLRAPITVIDCQSQSLLAEKGPDLSQKKILRIHAESRRLGCLVKQILDFARADSGSLRLQLAQLLPSNLLLESYDALCGLSPKRVILLSADEPRESCYIFADFDRVLQCMTVLVENALMYTNGKVFLGLRYSEVSLYLYVEDQGPGIPLSERASVIKRFVRGSSSKGTKGSGIGLASVSELMTAMNGKLIVDHASSGGALMKLEFPVY